MKARTDMRHPNSEGGELRSEGCRAGQIGRQSGKYKDYLGATFTGHLDRQTLENDCPMPYRTAECRSFLLCSLQHKAAGYVLPVLFIAFSQFPDLNFDYSVNIY